MVTDRVMVVSFLIVPWLLLYPRVAFDAGNVLLFFGVAVVLLAALPPLLVFT